MDLEKVMEAIAPPQDCATCEHLNLDQTMPLTDPPIPIAYCPKAYMLEDCDEGELSPIEVEMYENCARYWGSEIERCPCYSKDMTKDELKARIAELEQELKDRCYDCEYRDGEYEPDYSTREAMYDMG